MIHSPMIANHEVAHPWAMLHYWAAGRQQGRQDADALRQFRISPSHLNAFGGKMRGGRVTSSHAYIYLYICMYYCNRYNEDLWFDRRLVEDPVFTA